MDNYKRLNFYRISPTEVMEQLHTQKTGLTQNEVVKRMARMGPNELTPTHIDSPFIIFLRQFKNLLVIMLILSAGLSIYLNDAKTAIILLLIAAMNAIVGYMQEHKAESMMESLSKLLVPKSKVVRNAKTVEIESRELVLGDIVYLEEGDSVPADLRVIEEDELSTNDFALTGESNPSRKFVHAISGVVPLPNRHNLCFMGTTVATGTAYAVVVGTGMNTELGRIASLSQNTKRQESPLQKEMNHLATRIAQGTVVLSVILIAFALKSNFGLHNAILFGIGIGAAMIPNGLVAEVNITLAQTANRLAKAKALVKKLAAVETLGATNFILTDKTGTLTKNEMTIEQFVVAKNIFKVTGTGYAPEGSIESGRGKPLDKKRLQALEPFFAAGALASNARVNPPDEEHAVWYVVGDPTEGAVITLARKAGLDLGAWEKNYKEHKEFQFDSARKMLSTVREHDGKLLVYVKGAPEAILNKSKYIWENNKTRRITKEDREFYRQYYKKSAKSAMRNLAYAYRVLPTKKWSLEEWPMEKVEENFIFMGIVSMIDPLREAVPEAMKIARQAHVKVSVVTGDYPLTANAIATQAGLSKEINIVTGEELNDLADSQIMQLVEKGGAVFSRVAPEDKLRIVEIARQNNHVVAVTGDGINDAPALKRADIGVAMGKTGTDVAKDSADIILLDDSFNTLVKAIEQGRLTFKNIRKAARCALTDNAGELFTVLLGVLALAMFNIPPAISPIQILAIDVVAQILPITALGWDKPLAKLMQEQPRNLKDHIINFKAVAGFIGFGLLASILSYANFLFFFDRHHLSPVSIATNNPLYLEATTLTYLTLVLCLYVYLLFERADQHQKFFSSYLWSNKRLLLAFAASFFLICNIIYNPIVSPYFKSYSLTLTDWLTAIMFAAIYTVFRLTQRHTRKHTRKAVLELHQKYGATI